jgi:release factor glutamine methyltransferase
MAKSSLLRLSSSASLDVELLLCHALDCDRVYLRTWPEKTLNQEQSERFNSLFLQRLEGQPIAHLTGTRDFWSLKLNVNSHTLIPRPDTEVLIEKVLDLPLNHQSCSVLDLGTGTGAIALAIASEMPHWSVCGVDRFDEVVQLAKENAVKNDLSRVTFLKSDWFSALEGQTYQLIVSNPPYIDANDRHLNEGDVKFEPRSALVAEDKGMADIMKISDLARCFLDHEGWLLFEHGFDQGDIVRKLMLDLGYQRVETFKDYGNNDRVTRGQWIG